MLPQKTRYGSVVPVRLSGEVSERLDRAVAALHYRSRNEFIRDAIESHLEQMSGSGVVELREVSVVQAQELIEEYVSQHPGVHHVSELSEALGIELGTTFKAVRQLIDQRKVRVRKQ